MDTLPLREPSAAFSDRPNNDNLDTQRSYIHRSFTAAQRPYLRHLRHSAGPTEPSQHNLDGRDVPTDDSWEESDAASDAFPQASQVMQRPAFAIISNVALKAEPAVRC